jgi:hypothetical protein
MSVAECMATVSSAEFTYWKAKFQLDADDFKNAQKEARGDRGG